MNYVLTYAMDGHEISTDAPSLDAVNARIRKLYDEEDAGNGEVAILRIEEEHDGPRIWAIEYPPAPPAGTRVRVAEGGQVIIGENGRAELASGANYSWRGLLEDFGPLTEVVETKVEIAARRLREGNSWASVLGDRPDRTADDIAIVLAHVLNGGQL